MEWFGRKAIKFRGWPTAMPSLQMRLLFDSGHLQALEMCKRGKIAARWRKDYFRLAASSPGSVTMTSAERGPTGHPQAEGGGLCAGSSQSQLLTDLESKRRHQ